MSQSLSRLIELARAIVMTEEQKEEQRRSFVFGNTDVENPNITRAMVDKVMVAKKGK